MASVKEVLPEIERSQLVTLFNSGRYAELESRVRVLAKRYPYSGFVWKVLGIALQVQGKEALAALKKAAELLPDDAEALSNLGVAQYQRGRFGDAAASYRRALKIKPNFAEAHSNLGNALQDLGQFDDAVTSFRLALEIRTDFVEVHCNLGNALQALGKPQDAAASCRRALQLKPDYAQAHNNLGNALSDLGRLDDAVESYRRALQLKPDYAEAHSNLGNALNDLGRLDEAVASYYRALQLKPDYAEAHSNLADALQDMGRTDEAMASCRRALEIKPDYHKALCNLALLLDAQGESASALETVQRSLRIKDTAEAKRIFVTCIKHLQSVAGDTDIRANMVRALNESWGRPSDLARIGIGLVRLNPHIAACLARAANAWPRRIPAKELYGAAGLSALTSDTLLRALLESAPVCDVELERLLTMARHSLLDAATDATDPIDMNGPAPAFFSALARQCFINEYVFATTADEGRSALALRDSLRAAMAEGAQVPVSWLLAIASYFPLYSLPVAAGLQETSWPPEIEALLVQQLREPEEEQRIRGEIVRLTEIDEGVSRLVQDQYEGNPYPRWVKSSPAGTPVSADRFLHREFPLVSIKPLPNSAAPDILIAGCGTGRHSIETAQRFQHATVLAIDLSLSSLAYAKRKTRELGLSSLDYAQADILKLGALDRRFDVIESVGVLHHLADPWAGWRVLLTLLRPGGCMRLGFYSELARRNIVKARNYITEGGFGSTVEEIRRCRQELLDREGGGDFGAAFKSSDFFSTSACRDLLFHVQEHRLCLADIDRFLRKNGLHFLGFEIGTNILHAYKRRFPNDPAATSLEQWGLFEAENPDIFFGMYQFWIQS